MLFRTNKRVNKSITLPTNKEEAFILTDTIYKKLDKNRLLDTINLLSYIYQQKAARATPVVQKASQQLDEQINMLSERVDIVNRKLKTVTGTVEETQKLKNDKRTSLRKLNKLKARKVRSDKVLNRYTKTIDAILFLLNLLLRYI